MTVVPTFLAPLLRVVVRHRRLIIIGLLIIVGHHWWQGAAKEAAARRAARAAEAEVSQRQEAARAAETAARQRQQAAAMGQTQNTVLDDSRGVTSVLVWKNAKSMEEGTALLRAGVAAQNPGLIVPYVACAPRPGTPVVVVASEGWLIPTRTVVVTEGEWSGCRGVVSGDWVIARVTPPVPPLPQPQPSKGPTPAAISPPRPARTRCQEQWGGQQGMVDYCEQKAKEGSQAPKASP
jgi:hypothetical protein